jgi:hypothetical protein
MPYDPYAEARAQLSRNVAPIERSKIPKVVGILAIIFSSLGLITATIPLGLQDDLRHHHLTWTDLGSYTTWMMVWVVLGLAVSGVHLAGGIAALRYRRSGPTMLTLYAIGALVLIALDVGVSIKSFPLPSSSRAFDDLVVPRLGLDFLALPWPIVVLSLINGRNARQSCR